MHTHTTPGKIKLLSAIARLTAHFTCDLISDLMICKHKIEYDTKRPLKQIKTETQTPMDKKQLFEANLVDTKRASSSYNEVFHQVCESLFVRVKTSSRMLIHFPFYPVLPLLWEICS